MATRSPSQAKRTLDVSNTGPVQLKIIPTGETTATLQLGVDYAKAPVPQFHYDADYCDVREGRTGVILIFGKLRPEGSQLRTKIEISMSPKYFVQQLWKGARPICKGLAEDWGAKRLTDLVSLSDPDRVQCLRANNVFMGRLEDEAVLDFYYISPGDIHLVHKRGKPAIDLEPVVRVGVSSLLLLEFLEKCEPLATRLRAEIDGDENDD